MADANIVVCCSSVLPGPKFREVIIRLGSHRALNEFKLIYVLRKLKRPAYQLRMHCHKSKCRRGKTRELKIISSVVDVLYIIHRIFELLMKVFLGFNVLCVLYC